MNKTVPPGAAILLDFIRETEVGRVDRASYDVIYGNNQDKLPRPVTSMTLDEVEAAQAGWSRRFGSSAAGGYQFMKNTLDAPRTLRDIEGEMGLTGKERFTPDLQDRIAYHLLTRRGYRAFIAGRISRTEFGKRLAQEWASLPVLADTKGATRKVRRGQSYYAGDGLNRALVGPEAVEAVMERALEAARRAKAPGEAPAQPESPVRPEKPIRKSGRFWTWLLTAGGSILTGLKELNLVALDWRVQLAVLTVIVGFAAYAITSMPAVRRALGGEVMPGGVKIAAGVLVLAAIAWAVLHIREEGARSVKQTIERQNNEAALQSAARRGDFDRCVDGGGLWDFGAGECRRPPSGGRN